MQLSEASTLAPPPLTGVHVSRHPPPRHSLSTHVLRFSLLLFNTFKPQLKVSRSTPSITTHNLSHSATTPTPTKKKSFYDMSTTCLALVTNCRSCSVLDGTRCGACNTGYYLTASNTCQYGSLSSSATHGSVTETVIMTLLVIMMVIMFMMR